MRKVMKKRDLTRDKIDFGNGEIGKLFRSLFFPTLVGMISVSLATVVDGIFVGRGVGAEGIAAVNIVAPLWMVCTGLGLMFGIGASVVASLKLAEQNVKAARIILTQAFGAGLVLMLLLMALCALLPRPVVYLLGCSPLLEPNAIDYLTWLLPGMPFLLWQCVGMMLIRLDGSPRYAMMVQVVGALVNIVLDYVFVFPLGMGVKGAAIATSLACISGGLMAIGYFVFFSDKLKFYRLKCSLTSFLLTMRNVWYMTKIGSATFLTEITMSITMLAGNYMFMSMLHEDGVAAFAIACYLFPVIFSVNNAVAQSAQPIISYNYGIHCSERVKRALHVSLLTAVACGLCVTLLLFALTKPIVGLFLAPSAPAYDLAVRGLPLFATCAIFFAVNIAAIGYCQSIERPAFSTVFTILRGVVFVVPCFILTPHLIGTVGLWLAIPFAEMLTLIVIVLTFLFGKRTSHART